MAALALVCVCLGTCISVVDGQGNMSVTYMGLIMSFCGSACEAVCAAMPSMCVCVCLCINMFVTCVSVDYYLVV